MPKRPFIILNNMHIKPLLVKQMSKERPGESAERNSCYLFWPAVMLNMTGQFLPNEGEILLVRYKFTGKP